MNKKQKKEAIQIGIGALIFVAGLIMGRFLPIVGNVLLTVSWLWVGREVLQDAWSKLRQKMPFDEDFLMTVASVCALFLGEFVEAAAVMLFFQVGELFEHVAVERSRRSVAELMDLRPDVAYILRDGEYQEADPEDVQIGDLIRVNPGERIPVDGVVESGSASVDTSKITGESMPVDVLPGDKVLSGSINLSGVLVIWAESAYEASTVARILELMDSASEGRSKTESLITRFAHVYTPAVVYAALAVAFLPPLFTGFNFGTWIHRALNFLVVSCPCALVISVPLAYFSGMGAISKGGMIAKGGIALENLDKVDAVVFDKTGTLTTGEFRVKQVVAQLPQEEILSLAASVEQASNHPIARAIVAAAHKILPAEQIQEIPGFGIQAVVDGRTVSAGNKRMMESLGADVSQTDGATVVYIALDGKCVGTIMLEDSVKQEAPAALAQLRKLGIKELCMLTGDRREAANHVAKQLGMDRFYAGLLPEDKVEAVRKMKESGMEVAFVGDGVNDAPVMALSAVGVSMGGVGSDAAVEASDLVLLKDDLMGIPSAIRMARNTISIARQNIIFALAIKFGVMALSIPGIANMWLAVFADVGVAMLCILNSMRALKQR